MTSTELCFENFERLKDLAALDVAELFAGAELATYADSFEGDGGRLRITWSCKSAAKALGPILKRVWHEELGFTSPVIDYVEEGAIEEPFTRLRVPKGAGI